MAVPQSCFEASVSALPWINVMCAISQVAAVPLQQQRQEAKKQPEALHSFIWDKGGGLSLSFSLLCLSVSLALSVFSSIQFSSVQFKGLYWHEKCMFALPKQVYK